MKNKLYLILFSGMLLSTCLTSCNKDNNAFVPKCDGSTPTYNTEIASIIDANCIQCHTVGDPQGDFTSYFTLQSSLIDGSFNNRVLILQDMPQSHALSQDELNLIQCWVDNNYPDN